MQNPLLYLAIGLSAGLLAGFFGVGGGIIIIPLLVILLKFSQHAANGTSLVALLLPVGILGVLQYYKAGKIGPLEIRAGLWIALGILVGAYFGSKGALLLPPHVLRRAFAVFIVLVAIKLWFHPR